MPDRSPDPATVVRPPPRREGADGDPLPGLAQPLLELARRAERDARPDAAALARELRAAVVAFETGARAAGLPARAIVEARDALVAVVEQRAAGNPRLSRRKFARALRDALPVAVDTQLETLRARRAAAEREGARQRDLARFLGNCQEAAETAAARVARAPAGSAAAFRLAAGLFVAALAGWAGWAEWSYRDRLLATLPAVDLPTAEADDLRLDRRAEVLARMRAAVAELERRAAGSPLRLIHRLDRLDPAAAARARYARLADALLSQPVGEAVAVALATEGEAVALYDSLRAWTMLTGGAPWQAGYLAGWLADRGEAFPDLAPLLPHVAMMSEPRNDLDGLDPHLLSEARRFAAESAVEARAFLELARSPAAAALPAWSPARAVPGIEEVLIRRSGRSLARGIDGLYTAAGWAHARDGGVAGAIARAARESERLLGAAAEAAPEAVLDEIQRRTLEIWRSEIADLRVRPFADQPSALMLTGRLAARDSLLAAIFRSVWREVGGEDRNRSHANQLRIATAFGPVIQFVEQGRMQEIAGLFASLNVALQALDHDAELGRQRLMDAQARARSLAALQHAPALVMQIIEDVLAQTAAADAGQRRVAAIWRGEVGAACRAAVDGRYPFADGPDADLHDLARALGEGGLVGAFFQEHLAAMIDSESSPWRWKPEGLLSGFRPETAGFFERALALGDTFLVRLANGGDTLTVTALAQSGVPSVSIGGQTKPVEIDHRPVTLAWPGPQPASGFAISFSTPTGVERVERPGPWGLLRFLDGLRLRPREEGRRFLVDVRLETARAYLQIDFDGPHNAVALRPLLQGLACPEEL